MTLSNFEIKRIKSLSQKKFRDEFGLFTVEGEKMVEEALHSGFEVEQVIRREEVGESVMARISSFSSPSPVLAVLRQPSDLNLSGAPAGGRGLFLALDAIRDPGNLGTILRIADWFGVDAVFASPDTVELFNPKTVQATMGAVFRVRFHYTDLVPLCRSFIAAGGSVYGTFLDGKDIYSRSLSTGETAPSLIVIGNESNGISPQVAGCVTDRLFIPPYPEGESGSESLNAAVATAITVAEFRRQGRQSG